MAEGIKRETALEAMRQLANRKLAEAPSVENYALAQDPADSASRSEKSTNVTQPNPNSPRQAERRELRAAIEAALLKTANTSGAATLENAMRNTADKSHFGKEMVEVCVRLKENIDTQVVTLMNMMNRALDIGTDGRAYTHDAGSDTIVANTINPDLVSSFRATEEVTRELEAVVRDMPPEIEKLFHVLDESHAEFVSLIIGEKYDADKRTFDPMPSIDPIQSPATPVRVPTSIEASLQAALGESANRAVFLQKLVEASKRLKEKIDTRVVTLLTMMNTALTRSVDNVAYSFDTQNNRMQSVPQSDLRIGFTTTENVARELADAVADMPREIQALISELLKADEEFNALIAQGLTRTVT